MGVFQCFCVFVWFLFAVFCGYLLANIRAPIRLKLLYNGYAYVSHSHRQHQLDLGGILA